MAVVGTTVGEVEAAVEGVVVVAVAPDSAFQWLTDICSANRTTEVRFVSFQ